MSLVNPNFLDRATPRQRVLYIAIACIAGILLLSAIVWIFSGGGQGKKEGNLIDNIEQGKGENNVIGNLVKNQQGEVNNAANNTNRAINDLHNSINRPSNSFDGNGANDRFCADFPTDPSCPKL